MMQHSITQHPQCRLVSSRSQTGGQHVPALRTQPRHATPHCFALRHWRNRRHGGVGTGLMKDTPGHRVCQRLVLSGIRDDGRGSRVRALGRQ